jgi:uncharacterized damage-inducible protein DinB
MNAKDAIRHVIDFSNMLVHNYVEDLSDADLLVRAVPNSNHIAWQLGHLIEGTHGMIAALGHKPPALPDGFAAAHAKETAASDDPRRFRTKAEYLTLMKQYTQAAQTAVDATPETALEQPAPESMRSYAPTVGAVLMLLGTHILMHVGQFVIVRRKLGKPALF